MKLIRALSYAARAWAVFPLVPNSKRPLTTDGFKSASIDANQIRHWWSHNPEANIGLATGATSSLVVIDVDVKNGAKGRESIGQLKGLPPTLMARTPSGGWHLYYSWPGPIRTSIGVLPGIDLKAEGGYVVAPGSSIDGRPYEWLGEIGSVMTLSQDIFHQLTKARPSAMGKEASTELIPEGTRNQTLARIAGAMRWAGMEAVEIACALKLINRRRCRPPLEEREVNAIATSIARYPTGAKTWKR